MNKILLPAILAASSIMASTTLATKANAFDAGETEESIRWACMYYAHGQLLHTEFHDTWLNCELYPRMHKHDPSIEDEDDPEKCTASVVGCALAGRSMGDFPICR